MHYITKCGYWRTFDAHDDHVEHHHLDEVNSDQMRHGSHQSSRRNPILPTLWDFLPEIYSSPIKLNGNNFKRICITFHFCANKDVIDMFSETKFAKTETFSPRLNFPKRYQNFFPRPNFLKPISKPFFKDQKKSILETLTENETETFK